LLFQLRDLKLQFELFGFAVLELEEFTLQARDDFCHLEIFRLEHLRGFPQRLDVFHVVQGHGG